MTLHLSIPNFDVPRSNAADIGREERLETFAPLSGQLVLANSGRIDPSIVVKSGRKQFRGKVLADRCTPPLLGCKHPHQRIALLLLCREDAGSLVFAKACEHRLRAHEVGCQHKLIAEHEAIEVEVMTVDLPAPRLVRGRLAEEADPVEPFAVFLRLEI